MKQAHTPAFIQVAETLHTRISNGHYLPGDLIPSARALEEEFQVSNITIRKALDRLSQQGFLKSRRGVGTQVAREPKAVMEIELNNDFSRFADSAAGRGAGLTAKLLETGLTDCPPRIGEILGIVRGDPVWRMRRVRQLEGSPVSYFINYGPASLNDTLILKAVQSEGFINAFQNMDGPALRSMKQRVRAQTADLDLCRVLKIAFGEPVFFVESIYCAKDEQPILVTHMYYRGDQFVYMTSIDI
jgi:GntR family transcriptional regulator